MGAVEGGPTEIADVDNIVPRDFTTFEEDVFVYLCLCTKVCIRWREISVHSIVQCVDATHAYSMHATPSPACPWTSV